MPAYIVVDLGFGDSGKGLLTDFLVRHLNAGVVVRYNGGAQAGHNVVTSDGRHHTFSQFGSGTFAPHVKTYLSRHVVIHPTALLVEGDILKGNGVPNPFSRLRLSDQALVITPYHQAANRIRELARGADRNGSCGVGVGEAVEDAMFHTDNRVLAGDLQQPELLRRKLHSIREQKHGQMIALCKESPPDPLISREMEIFERQDLVDRWLSSIARITELGLIVSDAVLERWLRETENVILEGAQGILLDADAGFHPYTTWSRCSSANAFELIKEMAPGTHAYQIGVMRSYAMRHGPGPLPTESDDLIPFVSEHNQFNEWQGKVRYGWFDAVLARYALTVTGKLDSLAVTHMDVLPRLETWQYCQGYQGFHDTDSLCSGTTFSDDLLTSFRLPNDLSLERREQFTQLISGITPMLEACTTGEETVIQKIELLLGQSVGLISRGPRAGDVQIRSPLPR